MKVLNLVLMFLLGILFGHMITPLMSDNQTMRNVCPFVSAEDRDQDALFIKFLSEKYDIRIEKKNE